MKNEGHDNALHVSTPVDTLNPKSANSEDQTMMGEDNPSANFALSTENAVGQQEDEERGTNRGQQVPQVSALMDPAAVKDCAHNLQVRDNRKMARKLWEHYKRTNALQDEAGDALIYLHFVACALHGLDMGSEFIDLQKALVSAMQDANGDDWQPLPSTPRDLLSTSSSAAELPTQMFMALWERICRKEFESGDGKSGPNVGGEEATSGELQLQPSTTPDTLSTSSSVDDLLDRMNRQGPNFLWEMICENRVQTENGKPSNNVGVTDPNSGEVAQDSSLPPGTETIPWMTFKTWSEELLKVLENTTKDVHLLASQEGRSYALRLLNETFRLSSKLSSISWERKKRGSSAQGDGIPLSDPECDRHLAKLIYAKRRILEWLQDQQNNRQKYPQIFTIHTLKSKMAELSLLKLQNAKNPIDGVILYVKEYVRLIKVSTDKIIRLQKMLYTKHISGDSLGDLHEILRLHQEIYDFGNRLQELKKKHGLLHPEPSGRHISIPRSTESPTGEHSSDNLLAWTPSNLRMKMRGVREFIAPFLPAQMNQTKKPAGSTPLNAEHDYDEEVKRNILDVWSIATYFMENGHSEDPQKFISQMHEMSDALHPVVKWARTQGIVSDSEPPYRITEESITLLEEFYENYFEEIRKIGRGAWGHVYAVQRKMTGSHSAVKKLFVDGKYLEAVNQVKKEALQMADLSHPSIVNYHSAWLQTASILELPWDFPERSPKSDSTASKDSDSATEITDRPPGVILYIEMELCTTNLGKWLENRNQHLEQCKVPDLATQKQSLHIFKQIMEALEYVHSKGIAHQDIKPNNIFMTTDSVPKLGDFGLASLKKRFPSSNSTALGSGSSSCSSQSSPTGSPFIESPFQTDLYSMGVILLNLLIPFHKQKALTEEIKKIQTGRVSTALKGYPKKVRELAVALVQDDVAKRPSAREILDNPLFSPMNSQSEEASIEQMTPTGDTSSFDRKEMPAARMNENSTVNTGAIPKRTMRRNDH